MARYDNLRKLERNKQLLEFAERNPNKSLNEIGQAFGITGSRAQKIIKTATGYGRPQPEKGE